MRVNEKIETFITDNMMNTRVKCLNFKLDKFAFFL